MPQTPREIVTRCLKFERPERIPRDMAVLRWAEMHYPQELAAIQERFPSDVTAPADVYRPSAKAQGDPYRIGTCVDEWGCVFENAQDGVHGEVKNPLIADMSDWRSCEPPYDTLPADIGEARDKVNRFCGQSDKFVFAKCCPRPWERMQFLRGTANSMMDIMEPEQGADNLLRVIHEFYIKELEFWVTTDVDTIFFMDDWGSQRQLLVQPSIWREIYKPLYKDYCELAHSHGKFAFMHSDGNISSIYDDLIEVGVDALNSQLFVMDMEDLSRRAKGKITFWGEIDRQHVLSANDTQVVRDAVRKVAKYFYDPKGGIIAQFELGPGGKPENAIAIFEEWQKIQGE